MIRNIARLEKVSRSAFNPVVAVMLYQVRICDSQPKHASQGLTYLKGIYTIANRVPFSTWVVGYCQITTVSAMYIAYDVLYI